MRLYIASFSLMVAVGMTASSTAAHEFWIEGAIAGQGAETSLELDLKVGQRLDGVSLPFIPDTIDRFEWVQGGDGAISGRVGDIPAARVALGPETAIIFHRTEPRRLVHRDWNKFLEYLEMEGLTEIAEAHDRRGLPRTEFIETYTRHAKLALVLSEDMTVLDRHLGSPLEIVLDRVERLNTSLEITGRLISHTRQGEHQIAVFTPAAVERIMSEEDGRFRVLVPADQPVLLNAVQLTPGPAGQAAWHSDWASMYFRLR